VVGWWDGFYFSGRVGRGGEEGGVAGEKNYSDRENLVPMLCMGIAHWRLRLPTSKKLSGYNKLITTMRKV
jgi:hypothetical protein